MLRPCAALALALLALGALVPPARASPAPLDCCGDGTCALECTEGCAGARCGACCNAVLCACNASACVYQPAIWTYTLDACPPSATTLVNMAAAITGAYAAGFSGIPALTVTTTSGVCDPATGVVVFTTALPNPLDSCTLPAGYATYAEIVAAGALCAATDPCNAACLAASCTAANNGGVNVNSVVGS
jgi:hypothetical protein